MNRQQDASRKKNVVDLRRWREERERRLRRAAEEEGLTFVPPPERIAWPFRVMALVGGLGFLAFGGFLAALPALLQAGDGLLPWLTRLTLFLFVLPLGIGTALFGADLMVRGILGREWTRALGERVQGWMDRHVRPLPCFAGISLFLLGLGLWPGRDDPALWEPLLYWGVGFLHILLHETGHLLGVRGVRYTPLRLVSGPLTVDWDGGRRTLSATRDWRWLFGGNVWFSSRRRTRGRDLAVCAAGPLANLLMAGSVLAVVRALGGGGFFSVYVRANLVCAALVLAVNLLPLPRSTEGYATDGRQILDLLRGRRIA